MSEPFLGEINLFAFNFPPKGWAVCDGQLLPINQNQGLFSLLGTTYGGDGRVNFALPDLRSRVPISMGQGPQVSNALGDSGGAEAVTINASTIAAHTHVVDPTHVTATIQCSAATADQRGPLGGVPAVEATGVTATYTTASPDSSENTAAIAPTMTADVASGGSQPHSNIQPYLVINYCIALQGIFPSQT